MEDIMHIFLKRKLKNERIGIFLRRADTFMETKIFVWNSILSI